MEKDEILLYVIIAGIIAAVIGAGIGYLLRRRIAEARIGSAEEKAAQLVASAEKERENALREAETLKKETIVQTREELHKLREEVEQEHRGAAMNCSVMSSVWFRRKVIWTQEAVIWNSGKVCWQRRKPS